VTLVIEAIHSYEMSVLTRATQRHIQEYGILQLGNLFLNSRRSYNAKNASVISITVSMNTAFIVIVIAMLLWGLMMEKGTDLHLSSCLLQ
jgi:hypothetical protein